MSLYSPIRSLSNLSFPGPKARTMEIRSHESRPGGLEQDEGRLDRTANLSPR